MNKWKNKVDLTQTAPNLTRESFEAGLRRFTLWHHPSAIEARRASCERRYPNLASLEIGEDE